MKIITAGATYLDIDAYAGCAAYTELLQQQGIAACFVSTAILNESIAPSLRALAVPLKRDYAPQSDDTFCVVDVSEPAAFDTCVSLGRVETVIDHRVGHEQFWLDRIGADAHIEHVGAACTLIYELWQRAGLVAHMSKTSATLLAAGILDNTLNFGAGVTTQRDKQAYAALVKQADLPTDFAKQYFSECEQVILHDVLGAITNDKKVVRYKTFAHPMSAGQVAIWDALTVLAQSKAPVEELLASVRPDWFLNIIAIGEGKSYLYTTNPAVKQWLRQLLGVTFAGDMAIANRMWLRKEILKQDLEATLTFASAQ